MNRRICLLVSLNCSFFYPIREICPDTPVAAESTTPVYEPACANATDIIGDPDREKHCRFYQLFSLQPLFRSSHNASWNHRKTPTWLRSQGDLTKEIRLRMRDE